MQRSPELVRVAQPATGKQRRLALVVVAVSAILFLAAVPFAKTPLVPVPAFIPAYEVALIACDVITAALLFGQFTYFRWRALLVLAGGYLFTAFITVAHGLTFPGLVTPTGLLGAGPQSTAWLYMFWHGAFPIFVIAYGSMKDRGATRTPTVSAMALTIAGALALAAGFTLAATAGRDALPPIMSANSYTPAMIGVVGAVWFLSAAALVAVWRRKPHSVLDLWLLVVMSAWVFDIGLAAVFNGGRFDLGFYAGRIYGLVAASVVLGILLAENARMYLRLAHAADAREAERKRLVIANEQLEQARQEAEGAEMAKGAFLATMSHEIRTPMNGILGMLELLSLMKLEGEQRTTLEIVRESGRSLLRIIDDILDFSRIEAGKLELRPEPTSIAAVMQRVCHIYSGNASTKGLSLDHRVDARIAASLMVDALRLQQILNNLVSNAIKFTDQGHVSLQAQLIERTAAGEVVRFVVEDSGPGISSDDRGRLFQPFAQAGRGSAGGTGLGLSICRRLAELMGGTLAMESALGVGTRVLLTLPMAHSGGTATPVDDGLPIARGELPADIVTERPVPTVAAARMMRSLVLVVDDHPVNRMLLVKQLAKLGYAAEAAADGLEAIAKLSVGGFGAIVTDCNMPEMDGYELARNIRAREARNGSARMPIIACTANALAGEAANCFAAGMDDYLAKPVSLVQLREKLAHWLPLEGRPPSPAAAPIEAAALAEITGGSADAEREVLGQFMRYGMEDAASLRIAIASRDAEGVAQFAHRMKGAASSIGAVRLAAACGQVEAAANHGEWPGLLAGMEEIEREISGLEAHIAGLEA
ncbi:MAG TPA: ATP-binding protein [Usitatibacter sp.]|nr:ATP-binding protein [Usitatibacter sp.]